MRWRELVPGLAVSAGLALVAWLVLRYGQVGAMRGDTIELVAPVASARGIMRGSEVWLAGYPIGKVRNVEFRGLEADTTARLVMRLQISARHRTQLRRDSYAQIRSGANLIGNPVVFILPGSPEAPLLADGDTLRTRPQIDPESFSSQVALASRHFPEIIGNVKLINAQLNASEGTLGALLGDNTGRLQVVSARAGAVARKIGAGDGTVGLALGRGGLATRAQAAMAQADTLRALLASSETSAGRFRRDSTLAIQVRALLDEVSIVRARLDAPAGTAGRALQDRAIFEQLAGLERELGALMADIKRRPLRYVVF